MLDKKDFVCLQPFEFTEFFDYKTYMCCPNWLHNLETIDNPIGLKNNSPIVITP